MSEAPALRISTLKDDIPLQASKWLSLQILIDADEMAALTQALGTFYIYSTGAVVNRGEENISHAEFLSFYRKYVESLKNGSLPEDAQYRRQFASVFTVNPEALFAVALEGNKRLVRILKPVIQLQAHRMDYSRADGKFRSMTFGGDSITWGIQFSYPQLYQDGKTKEIHQVDSGSECPNTPLFRTLQQWTRNHTVPTPFLVDGQKLNIPVRLGKNCIEWINKHPQLAPKGLQVMP